MRLIKEPNARKTIPLLKISEFNKLTHNYSCEKLIRESDVLNNFLFPGVNSLENLSHDGPPQNKLL